MVTTELREGQRPKAASVGGHAGIGDRSPPPQRTEIQDREGIKLLLDIAARDHLPKRLSHLWLDAGYTGEDKGAGWVQKVLGWTAEIVRHPPKMAPEEVMRAWMREWNEEGGAIDTKKFMPEKA